MHAMVLNKLAAPLEWTELADRKPGPGPTCMSWTANCQTRKFQSFPVTKLSGEST